MGSPPVHQFSKLSSGSSLLKSSLSFNRRLARFQNHGSRIKQKEMRGTDKYLIFFPYFRQFLRVSGWVPWVNYFMVGSDQLHQIFNYSLKLTCSISTLMLYMQSPETPVFLGYKPVARLVQTGRSQAGKTGTTCFMVLPCFLIHSKAFNRSPAISVMFQ